MSQSPSSSVLLLPGDRNFNRILATPPPDPDKSKNFVVRVGELLPVAVNERELDDYLEGGEYDEQIAEIDDLESDILYLPDSISYC